MMRMMRLVRSTTASILSFSPALLQKPALLSLGWLARTIGGTFRHHMVAFVGSVRWKPFSLAPRRVHLTDSVAIYLTPHVGEFDLNALFFHRLPYEPEVFEFFESIHQKYDAILEVGANVGVFTCFFSQLATMAEGKLKTVVALEPSRTAYSRLCENLTSNSCRNVCAVNAAASETTDLVEFFEPEGHLTNGSISKAFAGIFSDTVVANKVFSLGPDALRNILERNERVLIKIDAEGYEPNILKAWHSLLHTYQPDIIVEVLSETSERMAIIVEELGCSASLITSLSPTGNQRIYANPEYRDWFLSWGSMS